MHTNNELHTAKHSVFQTSNQPVLLASSVSDDKTQMVYIQNFLSFTKSVQSGVNLPQQLATATIIQQLVSSATLLHQPSQQHALQSLTGVC